MNECGAEDVRSYKFTSFDAKEEMRPTQSQLQAAESLVDALDLTQGAAPSRDISSIFVESKLLLAGRQAV